MRLPASIAELLTELREKILLTGAWPAGRRPNGQLRLLCEQIGAVLASTDESQVRFVLSLAILGPWIKLGGSPPTLS